MIGIGAPVALHFGAVDTKVHGQLVFRIGRQHNAEALSKSFDKEMLRSLRTQRVSVVKALLGDLRWPEAELQKRKRVRAPTN
jgi:hypothetical protein